MSAFPAELVREGLALSAYVGGPVFAALLVTGLVVGVFQAATQINDAAIGFLVKLGAAGLVCWALGGWMTDRLASFFADAVHRMANPF